MKLTKQIRVAVLCGGPSAKRGISLNSARSICDHLTANDIEVVPICFDYQKRAYLISKAQLYSNTPSDFDFKLRSTYKALSKEKLNALLKKSDLVFPVIHGQYGEDGGLQQDLEKIGCRFIGSPAESCIRCNHKYEAAQELEQQGFYTLPSLLIARGKRNPLTEITRFFKKHNLKIAIVKPTNGAANISVHTVTKAASALKHAQTLLQEKLNGAAILEPFCPGKEFSVIVLQNRFGIPVSLIPVEIENDYKDDQIFNNGRRHLAAWRDTYHCPARFNMEVIERIQSQAEQIFKHFGMSDFASLNGRLTNEGHIWFSDINTVSSMEQNSFLFLSAAQLGMSHRDVLRYIVRNAAERYGIALSAHENRDLKKRRPVHVLFGGDTVGRQVSLMSGTNVWLKLKRSQKFDPIPYLMDVKRRIWHLPYGTTLHHSVEQVSELCDIAASNFKRINRFRSRVLDRLALFPGQLSEELFIPKPISIQRFIKDSKVVFSALRGGIGESGWLQERFERARVKFNGSSSRGQQNCIDKHLTGKIVDRLKRYGIRSAPKKLIKLSTFKKFRYDDYEAFWERLCAELGSRSIIVKPAADSCSAGVLRLFNHMDLKSYISCLLSGQRNLAPNTVTEQRELVEMPGTAQSHLLFERFIETDKVSVVGNKLVWNPVSGWIEITCAVIGKSGAMKALNPSITVASGNVLSLDEKSHGGTGVNITPPPERYVSKAVLQGVKKRIERTAKALGIGGYARFDIFMHRHSGEIIVIEANTLPGLTPSALIFHQALAEKRSMYPREFLERIIELSL